MGKSEFLEREIFKSSYPHPLMGVTMEAVSSSITTWDTIIADRFVNELFDSILGSLDPRFYSDYAIRRKHLSKVFKELLQLKTLPIEKKEKIINRLIQALPEYPHKVAYLESKLKMLRILEEELPDILVELERLQKYIDLREIERSLKIDTIKQKNSISALREAINEVILSAEELCPSDIDKYLTLDQALSLLTKLYEKIIHTGTLEDFEKYGPYILILLLRIYTVLTGKGDIRALQEDIIEIAPIISKGGDEETLHTVASLVG